MITRYKAICSGRTHFFGGQKEITDLFNSAFNWGVIRADIDVDQIDDQIFHFSIKDSLIIKWRKNVELLRFDVDRIITAPLDNYITQRAKKWINTFPVMDDYRGRMMMREKLLA